MHWLELTLSENQGPGPKKFRSMESFQKNNAQYAWFIQGKTTKVTPSC